MKKEKRAALSGERDFQKRICKEMFYRFFCRVPTLLLWGILWFHTYSLCQYGRVKKNVPILLACLAVYLFIFVRFLFACGRYCRNSLPFVYRQFSVEDGGLEVWLNDYRREIPFQNLVYYRWDKGKCFLGDREGHFFILSCENGDEEFLKLRLSAVRLRKRCLFGTPVLVGGILLGLLGGALVIRSAIPYNGKLAWAIQEMKNTKKTELVHDNLYEDKLSGILEDIEKKVELPEKLCLATSFSLHFSPDGTIRQFDTMLKGFDENGKYVDSYLISYDRNKSDQIRIDLHGITNGGYEEEKDFNMLVDGMEVIPVKQTVGRWQEEEYGILYYGWRVFDSYDENVIYFSEDREILDTADAFLTGIGFGGYSISVYCPGNEEVTPYRYLFLPREEFEEVKRSMVFTGRY